MQLFVRSGFYQLVTWRTSLSTAKSVLFSRSLHSSILSPNQAIPGNAPILILLGYISWSWFTFLVDDSNTTAPQQAFDFLEDLWHHRIWPTIVSDNGIQFPSEPLRIVLSEIAKPNDLWTSWIQNSRKGKEPPTLEFFWRNRSTPTYDLGMVNHKLMSYLDHILHPQETYKWSMPSTTTTMLQDAK